MGFLVDGFSNLVLIRVLYSEEMADTFQWVPKVVSLTSEAGLPHRPHGQNGGSSVDDQLEKNSRSLQRKTISKYA